MYHSILIVDDEINILNAFQRILRKQPYTLFTAQSGEEGLKLLQARDVTVVVSDYNMPRMNGLDFLKQVRSLYPHMLTIMLTGQTEIQVAVKAINEVGVYKFIQKPWDDEDVRITLQRAVESIDLANERDRLMDKVKTRDAILRELENKFPGITKVEKDEDGYMMIS